MPEVIRPVNWQHGRERPRVGSSPVGPAPHPGLSPTSPRSCWGLPGAPNKIEYTQGSPAMPACSQEGRSDHVCQPSWPHLCGTRAALRCPVYACCFRQTFPSYPLGPGCRGCMLSTQQASGVSSGACSGQSQAMVPRCRANLRSTSTEVVLSARPRGQAHDHGKRSGVLPRNQACAEFC